MSLGHLCEGQFGEQILTACIGFATEAAAAARNWLFEHFPLAQAASFIRPDNFASKRVAERLAAVYERTSESRGSTYEWCVHYRG